MTPQYNAIWRYNDPNFHPFHTDGNVVDRLVGPGPEWAPNIWEPLHGPLTSLRQS